VLTAGAASSTMWPSDAVTHLLDSVAPFPPGTQRPLRGTAPSLARVGQAHAVWGAQNSGLPTSALEAG